MNIRTFTVKPNIPEKLKALEEISQNLWYSWNFEAISQFFRLDYDAWIQSRQNPTKMLGLVPQDKLDELAGDDSFLTALEQVREKFQRYQDAEPWYQGDMSKAIAYFSMEYGLDVSLAIYSGGLGVLSGDHLKSSSDIGIPLVGVGLLYRQGYFTQYLNADGFQQESYPENDWYNMPVAMCRDKKDNPITITVEIGERTVSAQLWEVKVGRNSLYLLDTNIEPNTPNDRIITAALYGGDKEMRIKQEILLGMGGIRALRAVGIDPAVFHMNEGHSAFLALERIKEFVDRRGLSFSEAAEAVWSTNVFTTHTPVPAGNERFSTTLMEKYFKKIAAYIGISWDDFLSFGREHPDDKNEEFCMTVLALKLSAYCNGVSRLHGHVSRNMWRDIWPGLPENEIPITHITNGVHPRTWISHDMLDLLDRYFGPQFYDEPTKLDIWDRIDRISNEELWRTHERRRERLVAFSRDRMRHQIARRGGTESQIAQAEEILSPYALTISFARRFATYKRATLLFRDPERLIKLLTDTERPVQLIFAGKAHPHDIPGKELIKEIVHFASKPEVRSRIVFLENYDMTIAKQLTAGSDLWLNTPRRPLEASGTSGMKAAMNGVLNLSILDGWWDEAYEPSIGWAIGSGEEYSEDGELQDEIESKALYDLLEREIIPAFYDRGHDGLPREWITKMKKSMREVGKEFCSHRMLLDYSNKFYIPALENYKTLAAEEFGQSKQIAAYVHKLRENWDGLTIKEVISHNDPVLAIGDKLTVEASVELGTLSPEDVSVELYYGKVTAQKVFESPLRTEMAVAGKSGKTTRYQIDVPCRQTGRQGYTVRVLPKHESLVHPFLPGLVKWA
jgi:glycogen phosphorylase